LRRCTNSQARKGIRIDTRVSGDTNTDGDPDTDHAPDEIVSDPIYVTFESREAGFEIAYPAGWQVFVARERASPGTVRSVDALENGEAYKATFWEGDETSWPGKFQVRRLDWPDPPGIEEVFAEFRRSDQWKDSAAELMLAGQPARTWVRWTAESRWREYLIVASGAVFHLRFDESNPNDPDFDRHKRIYAQIATSLRIR